MTEETAPAKKKSAKKARPAPATPPAPKGDEGGLASPRTWAIVGLVMVGGIILWRLVGTSYKKDVETVCYAEQGSGLSLEHDTAKVQQWIRDHLGTPEGNQMFSTVSDTRLTERPKKLQEVVDEAHVSPCPILASYQKMAAQGEARADMQRLCSDVTFPKLLASDDATRLDMIEKWIDASAKSPRTKEVGAALQQAATPADRAKVLNDAAAKLDMFACANAKTLETPPPPPPTGAPVVRLFADAQITGASPDVDLKKLVDGIEPDLVACYQDGLTRNPLLGGKLMVKAEFDGSGKLVQARPAEGGTMGDMGVARCISDKLHKLKITVQGPMASVLLPLELTHADK